jgi:hypothetical protein
MPLRLIDVGETNSTKDPFLSVEPNRTGTYLTLSYRWFPNPFKADCSNLSALCEKIPLDNMPPTIKDAITFTRWLGVQYLWVDALCILQNKEDWLKQSPLMHEIYGNALLNISADAAVKPDIGFLRHRHPLHTHTCLLPSMIRLPDGTPLPAGICPSYPEAEKFPDKSILANRGWIMQERFLSQRRLHFGTNEILWECHEFQASERFPAPKFESDGNGADSEWVLPLKMGIGGRKDMWRDDPFEEWERIIGLYTRMHLTNQSDKLAAISGLVRELVNRTEKKLTYIAGLWKEVFITELLWEYDQDAPKLVRACVPAMKPDGPYRAPSFSWASVNYPTSFVYSPNEKALDDDEAVLVDWDITLADPENNPYGPVKDGWAQLNGYTISYSTLRNVKTPNYNKSNDRPLQLDKDWEDMPESAQRKVICLLVYIVDDTNCLALAPIDGPRGEKKYRRVGLFSASGEYLFQATRHLWSRRTVTVV